MHTDTQTPRIVFTGKIVNRKLVDFQADPSFAPGLTLEAAISEQMARNEAAIAAAHAALDPIPQMTPFAMGAEDAADGLPFAPETLFGNGPQRIEYVRGFLAARPDCAPAQAYKQQQIAAGWDMFVFGQDHRIWNLWHAEGYQMAKEDWAARQAEKDAKPGLNAEPDAWVLAAEEEEIGRYEHDHRHSW